MSLSLEQLFEEAQKFGRVTAMQSESDRKWSVWIEFNTIEHVKLEAKSERLPALADAIAGAIEKAILIVETMKKSTAQDTSEIQSKLGIQHKILKALGVQK
jgi:hypothetical protein